MKYALDIHKVFDMRIFIEESVPYHENKFAYEICYVLVCCEFFMRVGGQSACTGNKQLVR